MAKIRARAVTLSGNRQFMWLTPRGRRPTQYEAYTVGQQSSPEQWLTVDWPVRFEDGRAPWTAESTRLRGVQWTAFRDPHETWQRPYVAQQDVHEQALAMYVPEALGQARVDAMTPAWRDVVLGTYYAAWPFVEYGEFLCLSYAVREALSDTLAMTLAFEAADKLRHGQDLVHLLFALQEASPGFSDAGARAAWLSDPALVPLRETIELIYSCNDWVEMAVAINLVLEPLAGELFKNELLAALAPLNGDAVTPLVVAGARRDVRRHVAATQALVRLALDAPEHAAVNRDAIQSWLAIWTPRARAAAEALAPLFAIDGIRTVPFAAPLERVVANQQALVAGLGLAGDAA